MTFSFEVGIDDDKYDYVAWWMRRPMWLRIILAPLFLSVMLVHSTIAMALFVLVFVPFALVSSWHSNMVFWRKMRQAKRAVSWQTGIERIVRGYGVFLIELGPKGPHRIWWIQDARDVLDPNGDILSWHDLNRDDEVETWIPLETVSETSRQWAEDRLGDYTHTAIAVKPTFSSDLRTLDIPTQRTATLVILAGSAGCISRRLN